MGGRGTERLAQRNESNLEMKCCKDIGEEGRSGAKEGGRGADLALGGARKRQERARGDSRGCNSS